MIINFFLENINISVDNIDNIKLLEDNGSRKIYSCQFKDSILDILHSSLIFEGINGQINIDFKSEDTIGSDSFIELIFKVLGQDSLGASIDKVPKKNVFGSESYIWTFSQLGNQIIKTDYESNNLYFEISIERQDYITLGIIRAENIFPPFIFEELLSS